MVGFLRGVYCVLMDSNVSYYLYLFVGLALSSQPKMVYRLVISSEDMLHCRQFS